MTYKKLRLLFLMAKKKDKQKPKILEKPKAQPIKKLSSIQAIKQMAMATPNSMVRGPNPNQINGYFRDSWILEKRMLNSWAHY